MSGKPEGYPLPWCEALDVAYWQVNVWLCGRLQGWRTWQKGRDMAEIIPQIDALIEAGNIMARIEEIA